MPPENNALEIWLPSRLIWDSWKKGDIDAVWGNLSGYEMVNRMCQSYYLLHLPENGSYRVEIIDVWEMKRTPAMEREKGDVRLSLPGKEGIAILAVRIEGEPFL